MTTFEIFCAALGIVLTFSLVGVLISEAFEAAMARASDRRQMDRMKSHRGLPPGRGRPEDEACE